MTDLPSESDIYGRLLEALRENASLAHLKDASILFDVLWEHYLGDACKQSRISAAQILRQKQAVIERFCQLWDRDSDPRALLIYLMQNRVNAIRDLQPDREEDGGAGGLDAFRELLDQIGIGYELADDDRDGSH